ncbi:exonuclease domain-containing protein [Falsarthrobacter nasiphocae]|uniref:DNA polymerase-3 subunit epsilon n=1 Tax=Falsarthrobacter nasiphocae TaxID=189863 RepID=A0AAE3YJE3_9MICC|nr:exonuclease domain-containing protein [Falsarthrobacter nasiphocae]MDR6892801.1 DNA polymerase-3 subunit epsilon [Falsarthrobacter nasiphocae]
MSVDFTAIDFETANGFRGSPCALGIVTVRGGVVAAESSTLIKPPAGARAFDRRNVRIHGIRPEDVRDAPGIAEALEMLAEQAGDDVLVAHNAAFDMGVMAAASEVAGVAVRPWDYACTVQMSRASFAIVSHSLPFSAAAAGAPMTVHHDALADARACAAIAAEVVRRTGEDTLRGGLGSIGVAVSRLSPPDPSGGLSRATSEALAKLPAEGDWVDGVPAEAAAEEERLPVVVPSADADPSNPLYGQRVLFTGTLGLSRAEAWRRAAACGARPVAVMDSATTMLVAGNGLTPEALAAGEGRRTSALNTALKLRGRGFGIEIVTEGEFLQRTGGHWPDRAV